MLSRRGLSALSDAKNELEALPSWPWDKIRDWTTRTRVLVKVYAKDLLPDFDNAAFEPSWLDTKGRIDLEYNVSDGSEDELWNAARAGRSKSEIISFMSGLLSLGAESDASAETEPEKTSMAESARDPRKVFVIYGRDQQAVEELTTFLRALDLQVLLFAEAKRRLGGSRYVGDIVAYGLSQAQAIIALLTPDEFASLVPELGGTTDASADEEIAGFQPRPNVLLETGMAMGIALGAAMGKGEEALAREDKRWILVTVGKVRLPSDLVGRHCVRLDDSTERRNELKGLLEAAGCSVNGEDMRWLDAGSFAAPTRSRPGTSLAAPSSAEDEMDETDIRMRLSSFLAAVSLSDPIRSGRATPFADIDRRAKVPAGSAKRYLREVVATLVGWKFIEAGATNVRLRRN